VPEQIEIEKLILNFSGDSALSAGYDSRSYLTLKAEACAVFVCVSTSVVRLSVMERPVPLKTCRLMVTRAA